MKTIVDSERPLANPPPADVTLVYIGGDTPYVWTLADALSRPTRWALPTFVRSDPPGPGAPADAAAALDWLRAAGVPAGVAVVLDLETAVNPSYVQAFGDAMHAADYRVLVYGSRDTLSRNPPLDGYYDAHPGEAPQVDPGDVATQYDAAGSYDLSDILDSVPLWEIHPPQEEDDMAITTLPDGRLAIAAKSSDSPAHLLVFTGAPGGTWSVDDVTDGLLAAAPHSGPYYVS